MHFEGKVYLHIKLTDYQYEVLKRLAEGLNISVSSLINALIPKLSRFLSNDFDLRIDYSDYLTVLDKVDGDKERVVTPHISLTRENHLFLRNVKNRNFKVSFAMVIRLLVEELLIKGEGLEADHSPISYAVYTILDQNSQLILPLPREILRLLL